MILTETKIYVSSPNSQFIIDGYSRRFRYDRNRFRGGVLIYIRNYIPCKELSEHKFPVDTEGIFIDINLRKIKWMINIYLDIQINYI